VAAPALSVYPRGEGRFSKAVRRWAYTCRANRRRPATGLQTSVNERVRHPPQSGWLDEWGRLKGGHLLSLGVARKRAFVNSSERSGWSIRGLLLADVLADLAPQSRPWRWPGPRVAPFAFSS